MTPATYRVGICPVDQMLFGDNRPARAGFDHVIQDQDPSPLTFYGAVGSFFWNRLGTGWPSGILGDKRDDIMQAGVGDVSELLGVCVLGAGGYRWYPKPMHLRCTQEYQGGRLASRDLLAPRQRMSDEAFSCPTSGIVDPEPVATEHEGDLFVSEILLAATLTRNLHPGDITNHVIAPSEIFRREVRMGLAIDNQTSLARKGLLFTRPYRRFRPSEGTEDGIGWGFEVWYRTPGRVPMEQMPSLASGIGFLGGDRLRAAFKVEDGPVTPLQGVRDQVAAAAAGECAGFLLYLLTPMISWGDMPLVDGIGPFAAIIGRRGMCSGWNAALLEPRPLLPLVPAGTVFFFKWLKGADRQELVNRLWLSTIGDGGAAGFGRIFVGIW